MRDILGLAVAVLGAELSLKEVSLEEARARGGSIPPQLFDICARTATYSIERASCELGYAPDMRQHPLIRVLNS